MPDTDQSSVLDTNSAMDITVHKYTTYYIAQTYIFAFYFPRYPEFVYYNPIKMELLVHFNLILAECDLFNCFTFKLNIIFLG